MCVPIDSGHTGVDHADDGSGVGIHEITFPIWVVQKLALAGVEIVPQAGETLAQAEQSVPEPEGPEK